VVDEIAHGDPKRRRSSMFSTHHTLKRLSSGIAAAAMLAALAAPAALAKQDPWFRNAVAHSAVGSNAKFITDTLAPGGGTAETPGYRFISDTLAPGGGVVTSTPVVHGFDWADAGIGAAGTAGLMLLLLGGTRLLSHRRSVLAV
jgi:hypothetical protein